MTAPLLSYAVSANQDPIQVSPQTGNPSLVTLMIVVSNPTGQYIDCQSISFSFLQGTSARDFFSDSEIGKSAPKGWGLKQQDSLFTAKPDPGESGKIGPDALTFVLSDIQVNEQPGTTEMTISEVTTDPNNPGILVYSLAKFPAQFAVGPLMASSLTVEQGQSTTLSWNGTAGATYELQYLDENSKVVTITETTDGHALPSTGSYTIENLQASTTFYLIVTVTVTGQDAPLLFQRWVPVSVSIPPVQIISFTSNTQTVSTPGDQVTFTWEVAAATQVLLNGVNVTGNSQTVSVTETTTYTLQAYGQGGPVTSSITVTVAPVAITSFTMNPTSVYGTNNQVPVTLAWQVQSASQVLLNNSVVTGNSAVLLVNDQTTFTLEATGYSGPVYESVTVAIEDVDLKVWVVEGIIECSFGANVGSYTATVLYTYHIQGLPTTLVNTASYIYNVSQPGGIQFSINLSQTPLFLVIKQVEVTVTGFPSGAITANYQS